MSHQHENPYGMEHHGGDILDSRPPVVDLQGSREQRGSAFELYRKPVGHNMRGLQGEQPGFYGSQPNIAQQLNQTNSPKAKPKLTKAQSFNHKKSEGFTTPKFLRKLSFRRKNKDKDKDKEREGTPQATKRIVQQNRANEDYRSSEPKMVQFSDLSHAETESMYSDRRSLYECRGKIYQDRESLYRERQRIYENKEAIYQERRNITQKIYQDRVSVLQEKQKIYESQQDRMSVLQEKQKQEKIYQDRMSVLQEKQKLDKVYQDRMSVLEEKRKLYQDRVSVLQEKQKIYDSRQGVYPDKRTLYQDLQTVREEADKLNHNQDFKEVKEEKMRTQLQRNNSLRERMYQSFREARRDVTRLPGNNRLYQSLRQVKQDISNLQDNQKIYDDFLKLRDEVRKLRLNPPATDQNKNPQEDEKLYQDFRKLREEVKKLKTPPVTDTVHNLKDFTKARKRDITSAYVTDAGAKLVNEFWGVSLEIPEGAIPKGESREIYFVVSDPRLCNNGNTANAPPLDLENGETMLSPLVMCGPQGTEFLKPVILNIPHYANTLPSLAISLKATDSEQELNTDWDNILLPSNHAANSVAVKVDHF